MGAFANDDDVVALARRLEPVPECLLAGAGRIHPSGVDGGAASLDKAVEQLAGVLVRRGLGLEHHTAHDQARDAVADAGDRSVTHSILLPCSLTIARQVGIIRGGLAMNR